MIHQRSRTRDIKTNIFFCLSKIHQKKHVEIASIKCIKTGSIFLPSKLRQKSYFEMASILIPSKLWRKMYAGTTTFFYPSKLRWRKYVKKMSIFCSLQSHQKNALKWLGYSSVFCFRCIDVISKLSRRWFNMLRSFASSFFAMDWFMVLCERSCVTVY